MYELIQAKGSSYYIESPAKIGLVRLNETDVCLIDSGSIASFTIKVNTRIATPMLAPVFLQMTS